MKNIFLLLIVFLFSYCNNTVKKQRPKDFGKLEVNTTQEHQIQITLEETSKNHILNWREYTSVKESLTKFTTITSNEALNNALQLSKLVKQLKDSIRPQELLTPSFRTRVNVLENETLRLKDMTLIRNLLSSKEIHNQVDKIMEAFSATNSKINIVYSQLEVEKEITNNIPNKPNSKLISSKKEFLKKQQ